MTRRPTAHLAACLVLVAGGCGSGDDDPSARDLANGPGRQASPSQGRGGLAPSAITPTPAEKRPATLAERLRIKNAAVWVEVRYDDGLVYGSLQDREVQLGRRAAKLRQIRRLRGGPQAEVELTDGTRLAGFFEDLRQLDVKIGEVPHSLDLTQAVEVLFTTPYVEPKSPLADATVRDTAP